MGLEILLFANMTTVTVRPTGLYPGRSIALTTHFHIVASKAENAWSYTATTWCLGTIATFGYTFRVAETE
jgi:hypothetical protein